MVLITILIAVMSITAISLLIEEILNKNWILLIASFVLVCLNGSLLVINVLKQDLFNQELFLYILYGYLAVYAISFLIINTLNFYSLKNNNKNLNNLLGEVKQSGYDFYLVTNHNLRINDISEHFLKELGVKKSQVKNKKLFDVLTKYVRVSKINDLEVDSTGIKTYFLDFKEMYHETEKLELIIYNAIGEKVTLVLTNKPSYKTDYFDSLVMFGYKKGEGPLLNISASLDEAVSDLEAIRHKFIAALELTNEAIFFNDLSNNTIWGNHHFSNLIKQKNNEMSIIDYKALIYKDDIEYYINKLANLTPENPNYEMRYRLLIGNRYEFIYEHGKRIFDDKNENVILGFVELVPSSYFTYTGIKEVDNLKNMNDLETDINKQISIHHNFQLVSINLTNLPEINRIYGRDFGNVIMGEFIKNLFMNFTSESSSIYRSSGLVFYLTLPDARKAEFFKRNLLANPNALDFSLNVGGNKVTLHVNIGVSEYPTDANNFKDLLKTNNDALTLASDSHYDKQFVYYRDLINNRIG